MAVNRYDDTRAWYAISTYSGYEDKVADSINQRTNTVEMADKIFEAIVQKEKQIIPDKDTCNICIEVVKAAFNDLKNKDYLR